MKYPCGLVKDIMPLFVDEVCSEESRSAVKEHLNECEKCREYLLKLQSEEIVVENNTKKEEELIKADSLKKIKKKLNSRLKRIVISSACAVVALISVYHILFTMPVKELSLEDVSVSVEVYPIDELEKIEDGSDAVNTIRADENDNSKEYTVKIPELGSRIKVSENVMNEHQYISLVSWSSPYNLSRIEYKGYERIADGEEGAIYVTQIGTTILNNKADEYRQTSMYLEFKKVEKIVYVDENGSQIILWEK